jgi:hypothetical protein
MLPHSVRCRGSRRLAGRRCSSRASGRAIIAGPATASTYTIVTNGTPVTTTTTTGGETAS